MHTAIAFFDNLVRSQTRLYNATSDRLQADHGIGVGQLEFLRYLRDQPESRVSDVATAFAVGIGTTSKAIDRFEKQGWVVRKPNPANRRSSILELTPSGRRLTDDAEVTFGAEVTDRLAGVLTRSEVAAVTAALTKLRQALEADGAGVPTG